MDFLFDFPLIRGNSAKRKGDTRKHTIRIQTLLFIIQLVRFVSVVDVVGGCERTIVCCVGAVCAFGEWIERTRQIHANKHRE